jgi:hypothetical protein
VPLPGQILLLGLIPGAVIAARSGALGARNEARWQGLQTIGGLLAVALAAERGLEAVAGAVLAVTTLAAIASLWPLYRELGSLFRRALVMAGRPAIAALAAAVVLYPLAEPVSLTLAPVPALCLLVACGRLCYLLAGGEPNNAPSPDLAFRRWLGPANPVDNLR